MDVFVLGLDKKETEGGLTSERERERETEIDAVSITFFSNIQLNNHMKTLRCVGLM